jgi:hypothetical protein
MVRDPCNLEIMHLLNYFRKATDWDGVSLCTSSQQSLSNTARQRVVFCLITVLLTPKPLHNIFESERATAEGRPSPNTIFYRYNSVKNGVAGSRTNARSNASTTCRLLLRNDKMWQTSNPFRVLRPGLFALKKCYHAVLVAAKQTCILCAEHKGLTNATIGGCMVFVLDLRRLFHRKLAPISKLRQTGQVVDRILYIDY